MNKASKRTQSYFIVTYGCQMNELDSERIAGGLEKKGYKRAESYKSADLVIINTCSVRQSAEDRVLGLVNNLKKLKINSTSPSLPAGEAGLRGARRPKSPKIVVTGCMLRYTTHRLKKILPDVEEFIPIEELIPENLSSKFYVRGSKTNAYVSIMRGCDNFCTYCVVPYSRGRERSRPIEEIYYEVKELVKRGYKQIMLLGQNVNSYHKSSRLEARGSRLRKELKNLKKKYKNNFAVLLALLHSIKGLEKISFITSNPHDMTKGIIRAMSLPKIDKHLHLAVQSGDDDILRRMNRKYTVKRFLQLIKEIREQIPDIKISTDIIVGFPGETKKQFENTVKLCKKVDFCKAYINKYSPRLGTAAYKMEDNIPIAEKKRRWKVLDNLINKS